MTYIFNENMERIFNLSHDELPDLSDGSFSTFIDNAPPALNPMVGNQWAKGNILSDETKKAIGNASRKRAMERDHYHGEEGRKRLSKAMKGRVLSEEHRRKLSIAQKKRFKKPISEETRRKLSEAAKRQWASSDFG